uniref:Uncharacterized protein n=1 Tax=Anopheles quadriannulatus TaxID=34691 RepID=A0A182XRV8_ANOQN
MAHLYSTHQLAVFRHFLAQSLAPFP